MARPERAAGLGRCGLWTGLAVAAVVQAADPLHTAIETQQRVSEQAAQSQTRVDQVFDDTRQLFEDYKRTTRELQSLRRYDDHLERMVSAQAESIAALQRQLDEIATTQREIFPLMSRMVATLEQFVELDLPFLLVERRQRVQQLAELIDDPQRAPAEKYRRILEAYQIENEYGRTVEAYRGSLSLEGELRTVEFLRVGRVVLIYRSLDGQRSGFWNQEARGWQRLPDSYRMHLKSGFRIAREQAAPDLLVLPVLAPQVLP